MAREQRTKSRIEHLMYSVQKIELTAQEEQNIFFLI